MSTAGISRGYPACKDVWVAGKVLPSDYSGCLFATTVEISAAFDCNDGSQLVTYDRAQMWAFTGKDIHSPGMDNASDPVYATAYKTCLG